MHNERMEDLIYLLENIKTELPQIDVFDINQWYTDEDHFYSGQNESWPLPFLLKEEKDCGTAACALGAAALWPKFVEQGLRLHDRGRYPMFEDSYDYDAGMWFFDLSRNQSQKLFNSVEYIVGEEVTPEMVAARARKMLEEAND